MHPEFFTIPGVGVTVKTYGFCLMVGFLSAVWLAMRRAERVKANADRVLDVSFVALVFGVGGARAFYVAHYWKTDFAMMPNKLLAAIDIRQGGLEFLGGFLCASLAILVYLSLKKESVRLYLDVLAPGAMWGLAFGRLGCFFNGCCFGGLCTVGHDHEARFPWAVQFPYGSPAHVREWEDRRATVPAELIDSRGIQSALLFSGALSLPVEQRQGPKRRVQLIEEALAEVRKSDGAASQVAALEKELKSANQAVEAVYKKHRLADLDWAQQYPSRMSPERSTSVSELQNLAAQARSLPVHPTQLYSAIGAILLSGLLSAVFYQRKRHGVVIGLLFVLYPISRVILEMIRADNPHDAAGLTISQFVSVAMFLGGVVYLIALYRWLPQRSPVLAVSPQVSR